MFSTNNKPASYQIKRTFGAWRVTFYNASGRATDAIEMRGTFAAATQRAIETIEMNK